MGIANFQLNKIYVLEIFQFKLALFRREKSRKYSIQKRRGFTPYPGKLQCFENEMSCTIKLRVN